MPAGSQFVEWLVLIPPRFVAPRLSAHGPLGCAHILTQLLSRAHLPLRHYLQGAPLCGTESLHLIVAPHAGCTLASIRPHQVGVLLDTTEIAERMSFEQRRDSRVDVGLLAAVLGAAVAAALVLSGLLLIAQVRWERQRQRREMLVATRARLRYKDSNELVTLPHVAKGQYQ